jgi:hypothetical protein
VATARSVRSPTIRPSSTVVVGLPSARPRTAPDSTGRPHPPWRTRPAATPAGEAADHERHDDRQGGPCMNRITSSGRPGRRRVRSWRPAAGDDRVGRSAQGAHARLGKASECARALDAAYEEVSRPYDAPDGQVGAPQGLFGVGDCAGRAESATGAALGVGQERHHQPRHRRHHDPYRRRLRLRQPRAALPRRRLMAVYSYRLASGKARFSSADTAAPSRAIAPRLRAAWPCRW